MPQSRLKEGNHNKMSKVKLYYSNKQKTTELPKGIRTAIRKCCEAALTEEGIADDAEVSLTVVDNNAIREMNREYRQKDSDTDVLSFPMSDGENFDTDPETDRIVLGDIVISAEKAEKQAKEYGHSLEREMCFLATHSMFHLLGYDHEVSKGEERIMFEKQEKVLKKIGINR